MIFDFILQNNQPLTLKAIVKMIFPFLQHSNGFYLNGYKVEKIYQQNMRFGAATAMLLSLIICITLMS